MIKVGIVGSEGYAVGELYSLLIHHPDVKLEIIYSPSRQGMCVQEVFNDLHGMRSLTFSADPDFDGLDVLFLCIASGSSKAFLEGHPIPDSVKIIDFSREHRHTDQADDAYVYGLPEAYRRDLTQTTRAAVPGSFAIAVETPLIPLAKHMLLNSELHAYSVAGKTETFSRSKPDKGLDYDVIFDTFQVNQPLGHSHVSEIKTTLADLQKSFKQEVNLIPLRGGFNRGLYTTTYMDTSLELGQIREIYENYFEDHSFVRLVDRYPDVRDATNTNNVLIHLSKHQNKLLIVSTMDNLMKGAAGNAVHIMNLMCSLVETTGLQIKPSVF